MSCRESENSMRLTSKSQNLRWLVPRNREHKLDQQAPALPTISSLIITYNSCSITHYLFFLHIVLLGSQKTSYIIYCKLWEKNNSISISTNAAWPAEYFSYFIFPRNIVIHILAILWAIFFWNLVWFWSNTSLKSMGQKTNK